MTKPQTAPHQLAKVWLWIVTKSLMAKSATDAVSLFSSTVNKLPSAHNAAANTNSQRINPTAHLCEITSGAKDR